jgi:hypothetical protein
MSLGVGITFPPSSRQAPALPWKITIKVERPQRSSRVAGGNCTPRLPQIPA